MNKPKYQVRDAAGRLWGEADDLNSLEPVCYRGQVLYRYSTNSDDYVVEEEQSPWMMRAPPADKAVYVQPSRNYRGDFIVTVKRGDVVGKSNDRRAAIAIASAGNRRALWQWVENQYVSVTFDPPSTHITHGYHVYKRPVASRDVWLVTAASGRVWARGNKVEDVMNDQVAGSRRALWQLTKQGYVLRAIGKEWIEEVQS